MKKILFIFVSLIFLYHFCCGQSVQKHYDIESIKRSYIAKEIKLNGRESSFFWQSYDNYIAEIRNAKITSNNNILQFDENVLLIRKKYNIIFSKILNSNIRANQVFLSERKFRDLLRKELRKRQLNN